MGQQTRILCAIIIVSYNMVKRESKREREREKNKQPKLIRFIYYFCTSWWRPLPWTKGPEATGLNLASLQACCRQIVQDIPSWQHGRSRVEGNSWVYMFNRYRGPFAQKAQLYTLALYLYPTLSRFDDDPQWRSQEKCALGRKALLL